MIRLGTRASALAVTQAEWVASRLEDDVELVKVADLARPDKSRWVSALEQALLDGKIDVAVHSAKDVPAELPGGLALVAFPAREDPRDVVCGASSLDELGAGARVGTSSLRREAQLRAIREDLEVVPAHGNVDTRLRKLGDGEFDALVLARAGLARLGRLDAVGGVLEQLVPAAGQGALALEARAEENGFGALNDEATASCVGLERELTRALGASCNTPVGAHAEPLGEGRLRLTGWVGAPDGSAWIRDMLDGGPEGTGEAMAKRLLACGARELLP